MHPPQPAIRFRPATINDATHLARLVDMAGDGLPRYFWEQSKPSDQTALEFGVSRARRETGSFSYANAMLAEIAGQVAGCLVSYDLDTPASPADYADMPDIFVPIQRLEDQAAGSRYISVLAVYPDVRGKGVGARLIETVGPQNDRDQTLIAADANLGAIGLYQRLGFETETRLPMVKDGWTGKGRDWLLMRKPAATKKA